MQGTVVYVDERKAKSGKKYWRVGVKGSDGEVTYLSTFSKPPEKGTLVEVEDGKLTPIGRQTVRSTSPEDRKSINRSVALKSATELLAAIIQTNGVKVSVNEAKELVLQTAEEFLEWLDGKLEVTVEL